MEWRSVSNDQVGKTFEGWSYQGTIFSPTGKNGYFQPLNQNNTQISVADPQNRVATESEFFTSERIDISNLDSGFLNIDDNDTGEYVIRDLVNLLPEASEGMNLFSKADHFYTNINYGTSASEIYPYISTDVRKTNYSEVENYLGGRFRIF